MQLTKQELNLIYNCLKDCINSEDWWFAAPELSGTMNKIKQMVKNLN